MILPVRNRALSFLALLTLLAIPACAPTAACPSVAPVPASGGSAASAVAAASPAQTVKQVYRFDFTLTLVDAGKAPVVTEHTLNLQETMPGELRTGKNVPLTSAAPPGPPRLPPTAPPTASGRPGRPQPPPPAQPSGPPGEAPAQPRVVARQDVGFLLRSIFQQNGDTLVLRSDVEMSNVDEGGAIQKLVVRGEAPFTPGKQVLVASSEDPVTHRKLSLSVTATPLR